GLKFDGSKSRFIISGVGPGRDLNYRPRPYLKVEERSGHTPIEYPLNRSRSADLRNLPAAVRGIASMNSNASGSQNFGNCGARNARSSSAVTLPPLLSTTAASGRSHHLGCAMATTAASATAG